MSVVFNGVFKAVAKQYRGMVAKRVAAVGLKYEDLLVESPDVENALKRIPNEVLVAREQRIKRAFDISAKRKTIGEAHQPKDPLDMYLESTVDQAQLDREERAILNSY